MTTELETLARRAVACKHWRWMPGMLGTHPTMSHDPLYARILEIYPREGAMWVGQGDLFFPLEEGTIPDLSDPATLGCLLALVREAWNDSTLGVSAARGGRSGRPARAWSLKGRKPYRKRFINSIASAFFGSETNALVTALEAAP